VSNGLAVEIKVNVGAAQIEEAMQVFGIDPDEGKKRRIWFGEVVDGRDGPGALPLLDRGVILRVREKKSSSGDSTVKLRGPDGCIDIEAWRTRAARFDGDSKIEGDWAGRRLVSASLDHDLDGGALGTLAGSPRSVTDLLSKEQQELAGELLVPLDRVTLLGPIAARKWEPDGDADVAAELWSVDDLQFLEISVLATENPEEAQRRLLQRAADGGLELDPKQETKTATVLRHLAARHDST
jgi:hypothetical protein